MDFSLAYCPDLAERLRSLYTAGPQAGIFACMEVETNALRKFAAKYPPGYTDRLDLAQRVAFWDELWAERAAIHDDSIPCAYTVQHARDVGTANRTMERVREYVV